MKSEIVTKALDNLINLAGLEKENDLKSFLIQLQSAREEEKLDEIKLDWK